MRHDTPAKGVCGHTPFICASAHKLRLTRSSKASACMHACMCFCLPSWSNRSTKAGCDPQLVLMRVHKRACTRMRMRTPCMQMYTHGRSVLENMSAEERLMRNIPKTATKVRTWRPASAVLMRPRLARRGLAGPLWPPPCFAPCAGSVSVCRVRCQWCVGRPDPKMGAALITDSAPLPCSMLAFLALGGGCTSQLRALPACSCLLPHSLLEEHCRHPFAPCMLPSPSQSANTAFSLKSSMFTPPLPPDTACISSSASGTALLQPSVSDYASSYCVGAGGGVPSGHCFAIRRARATHQHDLHLLHTLCRSVRNPCAVCVSLWGGASCFPIDACGNLMTYVHHAYARFAASNTILLLVFEVGP